MIECFSIVFLGMEWFVFKISIEVSDILIVDFYVM